jgi:hypothetical protein
LRFIRNERPNSHEPGKKCPVIEVTVFCNSSLFKAVYPYSSIGALPAASISSVHQRTETELKEEVSEMRYAIAWILGVPASIIVIWFVVGHLL